MLLLRILSVFFATLLAAGVVQARQVPQPVNQALADLSQRAGKTITINDLENWRYEEQRFGDASLGCPQPGQMYAQVVTPGYIVVLIYGGNQYEYRIASDGSLVKLCSQTGAGGVSNCPPPNDPSYLPPRLMVGENARVTPGNIPNNVRALAGSSSNKVGEIPAGAVMQVIGGPSCTSLDKLVWWEVTYNGLTGWTPEGQAPDYWLEPVDAAGNPINVQPLVPTPAPATARALSPMLLVENRLGTHTAVSADGRFLALGTQGALEIYDLKSFSLVYGPVTLPNMGQPSVAFNADGSLLAVGSATGEITVFQIPNGQASQAQAVRQMLGHHVAVLLAFMPQSNLLVSAGQDGAVRLWDATTGAGLAVLADVTNPIMSLVVTPDQLVITTDNTGRMLVSKIE